MSTRRGVLAAVALALAAGGCGADKLDPPRPRAVGTWRDTLPPVPESSMDGPLLYPLAPALAWLDTAIPPRLGDLEHRRESPDDSRLRYAYELRRDPFVLSVRGQSATLRTDIAYRVRAWYNLPVLPEVGTSCGEEGEGPRARVAVTMEVRLTPEWRLLPRSRASVDPLSETDDDKCTITPLEIDVTDDVVKAARGALQQKADEVNARLAAVDVPAEARRIWGVLQQPIRLTDSLWLSVNPTAVRIGVLELRGDTLRTTVGLTGRPRVTAGPRPGPEVRPLPPPSKAVPAGPCCISSPRAGCRAMAPSASSPASCAARRFRWPVNSSRSIACTSPAWATAAFWWGSSTPSVIRPTTRARRSCSCPIWSTTPARGTS